MVNFVYKQRGAISIFLVIILLPMLSIASIMVDTSRIRLARSVAESAGDLTLNTALSQYDNVLKEMYGLFAVSQSEEDLMNNLKSYYTNSLRAAGMSEADAGDHVGRIMKKLGSISEASASETDLLRISVEHFEAEAPEAGSLINPALLKSQMINFMKYRAPINTGLGFLDSLRSFSSLSKQMKVVETRDAYYKEQQAVVDKCQTAWKCLYDYKKLGMDQAYFDEMQDKLDSYAAAYEFISNNLVQDYGNSKKNSIDYFSKNTLTYATGSRGSFTFYYRGKVLQVNAYMSGTASASSLSSEANRLASAVDAHTTSMNDSFFNIYLKDVSSNIYGIQRVIQYMKDDYEKSKSYASITKDVYQAYHTLDNAIESIERAISDCQDRISSLQDKISAALEKDPPGDTSGYEAAIEALEERIDDYQKDLATQITINGMTRTASGWLSFYKKDYDSKLETFEGVTRGQSASKTGMYETINDVSKISLPDIQSAKKGSSIEPIINDDLVDGRISDTFVKEIYGTMYVMYEKFKKGKELLEEAEGLLDDVSKSVAPGGKLKTAEGNWEAATKEPDLQGDALTEQNKEELESIREFINKGEVDALNAHIGNTITTMTELMEEVDGYTYADKKLYELKSFDEVKSALEKKYKGAYGSLERPPLTYTGSGGLKEMAASIYKEYYKEPYDLPYNKLKQFTAEWEQEFHPELDKETDEHGENDYNKFYRFLQNNFQNTTDENMTEEINDKKEAMEKKKEALNATAESQQNEVKSEGMSDKNIADDSRPSKIWSGIRQNAIDKGLAKDPDSGGKGAGTMPEVNVGTGSDTVADSNLSGELSSMFDGLGSALAGLGITLRDDIYISCYGMDMFSYHTFENEIICNSLNGNDQTKLTAVEPAVSGGLYDGNYEIKVANIDKKDAMSLTCIPINPAYNAAYRSEVEYMIYGKDNSTNVTAAYASIFGIRLACNSVYAFTNAPIRDGAYAIAFAVFGTPPLTFMVPIAQAAIIIGIAIAESSLDLLCLKNGMKVPVFKNKDTWQMSFDNLFENLAGAATAILVEKTKGFVGEKIDTVEDTLNQWLNKTDDEINQATNDEIDQLTYAVETRIDEAIDRYASTAINQLTSLCQAANNKLSSNAVSDTIEYKGKNGIEFISKEEFVAQELTKWLAGERKGTSGTDYGYLAKKIAVEYIIEQGYIEDIFLGMDKVAGGTADIIDNFKDELDRMRTRIIESIKDECQELLNYKTAVKNQITSAISKGADSLKTEIDKSLDGLSGGATTGGLAANAGSANTTATFFSFQYSDYLQLFLVIALLGNQEGVLLRISDVIEANMKMQNEEFTMKESYTYVKIDATLEVKPILMTLPFMAEETESNLPGSNWYTIKYNGMQGYN
ncbi:hypothetical protein EDD66_104288 [Mobilisporobacter senegalensis]|uniref:Flp pilus-assembly TadE/G-like protein n=1 Tax=Mobilisporobacter senegalensis TaxID=1329262 RepID=A0A3N1XPT8_9FIRM|nr:DUF5702 domain-containing protein [Mobilisporobacter senegalensis]ROR28700.1 hypothetical protein EDD66_104288 [Mobilisporobacter senegalensis]